MNITLDKPSQPPSQAPIFGEAFMQIRRREFCAWVRDGLKNQDRAPSAKRKLGDNNISNPLYARVTEFGNLLFRNDGIVLSYEMPLARVLNKSKIILLNEQGVNRSRTTTVHFGAVRYAHTWLTDLGYVAVKVQEKYLSTNVSVLQALKSVWGTKVTKKALPEILNFYRLLDDMSVQLRQLKEQDVTSYMREFCLADVDKQQAMRGILELQKDSYND